MTVLTENLRHHVTIQRPVIGQDPVTGEQIGTWVSAWLDDGTLLVDVPAQVLTGPGREIMGAGSKQAEDTVRINLRWFPGFQTGWRVLWDGHIYDINSVEYDATGRREIRLRGTGGLSDGQ